MNRKQEIEILIPQLEKQYGEAHDKFKEFHDKQVERVSKHFSTILLMNHNDFELNFNEHSTQLRFEVNDKKTGELTVYHPKTYLRKEEDNPFRLSWYNTNACDVNNPEHFVYLIALGKIAEDFNTDMYLQSVLENELKLFKEAIKDQDEIGRNLRNLRSELTEIERVAKFQKIYDEGGVEDEFTVYSHVEKNRTVHCKKLTIDKVSDKTVTITFTPSWEFGSKVTRRIEKRKAEGLLVSIANQIAEREKVEADA